MNVYYGATRNLYPYLQGAIRSLLDHNRNVKLYICAEDDELPFEIPCEHRIINVAEQTWFGPDCPNRASQFTYMAMMRVCLPELIKAEKIITLDVDTIVCDSLEPLWNTDVAGKWVAMCPEHRGRFKPFGPLYYNFGVALLNLKQMRKDNVQEMAVAVLNKIRLPYTDQCVMNLLAVPDRTVDIDVRFNESFCCGYTDNPAIVHYAGVPDWYENRTIFRWEYLAKYSGR